MCAQTPPPFTYTTLTLNPHTTPAWATSILHTMRVHSTTHPQHTAHIDDCLSTGLLVTLCSTILLGLKLGTLTAQLHTCTTHPPYHFLHIGTPLAFLQWSLFRSLAPLLQSLLTAACTIHAIASGAAGVVILCTSGVVLMRWRLLQGLQRRPLLCVGALLGVGGGVLGAWGVRQLGGLVREWVCMWVLFVGLHLWALLRVDLVAQWVVVVPEGGYEGGPSSKGAPGSTIPPAVLEKKSYSWWCGTVLLSVVLPLCVSAVPFWPWWGVT